MTAGVALPPVFGLRALHMWNKNKTAGNSTVEGSLFGHPKTKLAFTHLHPLVEIIANLLGFGKKKRKQEDLTVILLNFFFQS